MRLDNLVYATILGTGTLIGGQAITPGKVNASQQQIEKQEEQSLEEQVQEYTTQDKDKPEYWYDKAKNLRQKAQSHKGSDTETYERLTDKAKDVFLKGVDIDMDKPSAESILKPYFERDLIEKIKWEPQENSTNLNELVYQKNIPKNKREPSLVLFYAQGPTGEGEHHYTKRSGIVFKRLAEKYQEDINFIAYPTPDHHLETNEEKTKFNEIFKEHNIDETPSIAMYSPYNVVEGETKENNNGVVEQIDILRGGPGDPKSTFNLFEDLERYWLSTNITNLNGEYVWQLDNSKNINWSKKDY